jgi:hypothetical protein
MVSDEVSNIHDVHVSNIANPLGIKKCKYMFIHKTVKAAGIARSV